jgi:predicted amidohydrolase YtcJ
MRVACCPGVAAFAQGALGNLTTPAFAPLGATDRAARRHTAEPERAVILRGGPILTVDHTDPVGEALAIRGSRILEVGSLTEVKRHYTPTTEIVDLEGRAVLPGFVEPHAHVVGSALAETGMQAAGQCLPASVEAGTLPAAGPLTELCAETLRRFAARGCTTVYDTGIGMAAGAAEHELLRALAHAPGAPVRLRGAFTPELAAALGARPGGDERYAVVGISDWADGPVHERAAALEEPYLNGRETGRLLHEEAFLREAMRAWHRAGWQLVVHANGDRAVAQALRCYEAILAAESPPVGGVGEAGGSLSPADGSSASAGGSSSAAGPSSSAGGRSSPAGAPATAGGRPVCHRLEHVTVARDEQVAQAASLGLAVSHTINHVYFLGEVLRDEVLGPERAARIHSLRRDREHGLASSCHSGSPLSPVDPCLALRTAATRLMRDSDDVLGPFQQLTLAEALRTVTSDAADHVLFGDRVGSLRPGMLADLVVLDRDPREVTPERLHELRVTETWLGGRRQQWS